MSICNIFAFGQNLSGFPVILSSNLIPAAIIRSASSVA